MDSLLTVKNLNVSFNTYAGEVKAVRGVSFDLGVKEALAMVGESGCGKTVTSKAVMRLLSRSGGIIKEGSRIEFMGQDILGLSTRELNRIRGSEMSMIFQDSMTSLNPTMTIGNQIMENIFTHEKTTRQKARERAIELLKLVEIPNPETRLKNYPHQLSGGMRQRVMIAIALALNPSLLIADEPTTALDVTIQAQLMDLLRSLKERFSMSVILVTHDLGVVADFADKVQVMYAGTIVERGTVDEIFDSPRHPYTWALLSSIPGRAQESKSKLYSLQGTPPDLLLPLQQCPFAPRCQYCMPICKKAIPKENFLTDTHGVACWLQHPMAPKVTPPAGIGGYDHE